MKRILITGASGFIGSFIVEEALRQGFETWAAVRRSSSKKYLSDDRIRFIELNLLDEEALRKQLADVQFDYIIHAAGVTKSNNLDDFININANAARNIANAVVSTQHHLERLVFISSLSVMGAIREQYPYTDITDEDKPQPNSLYGKSKLMAEKYLEDVRNEALKNGKDFRYIVLRPTGVYGPREKDYMMMVDSIKNHVDFAAGRKPQDITFVYVRDLVQAIFLALTNGTLGKKYFITDGNVYQSKTFSQLIRKELGYPFCLRIVAPIWLLHVITRFGTLWGKITGKITALNNDKYHILRQRNWRCDITPAIEELGYKPRYDLARGVKEMMSL